MADKLMLDTSILINYYRRTDKERSVWVSLIRQGYSFAISIITKYEIYSGATPNQLAFWDHILQNLSILPFDEKSVDIAVLINNILKKKRNQIDLADLFIAATAVANKLALATLNKKHFSRIDDLTIVE